ncbi:hypothetical protein [Blautia sp. MSJ-9]|uniref:hypothetical protein n=1 Tax=Blautia sp. MSJ-9 TaxID=2841511 RepID=UPI001C10C170|nr:hypothetical protein [Blautia sp. MSJ-9]MBU5679976.1 hypothetical protein [Blautia sp. MSJ-9]
MANTKQEDAVMKMGFDYFRNTILKTLGIDYQYEEIGPTELVELTIHSLYMDFTFLTTGGFYVHTEFQTTDKKEADLRRFHAYDAVYSNKTGKKVITYVIYSGGITNVKSELDCGLYTYRVQPIYLKDKNADEVFQKLKQKQDNGEAFTEDDYAALSLTPLMSGKMSRKDMFKEAISLAKPNIELSAEKATAMLYTLADKFLDKAELDEIKEVMRMTRLGQMLMDEGMEKGIEKGIELNQTDSIKKLMKNMSWTIDQAMNALEVPEDKREKYRQTIITNN